MKKKMPIKYESIRKQLTIALRQALLESGKNEDKDTVVRATVNKCINGLEDVEKTDPHMLQTYLSKYTDVLIKTVVDSSKAPATNYLARWRDTGEFQKQASEIDVGMRNDIMESADWQAYEARLRTMEEKLTQRFTKEIPTQQWLGRTTHRDILVKTTVDKIMIEARKDQAAFNALEKITSKKIGVTTKSQSALDFLKSSTRGGYEDAAAKIAATFITNAKALASGKLVPAKPSAAKQQEPAAQNAPQETTPEEPQPEKASPPRTLYESEHDATLDPTIPVMVLSNVDREGTIVLNAIREAHGDGGPTPTAGDFGDLNQKVNDAVQEALKAGTLTPATVTTNGNARVHTHGNETVTETKDKDGNLIFQVSENFSGVLKVQRKDDNGKFLRGAFDVVEYQDGKAIAWSMAEGRGHSRIAGVSQQEMAASISVSAMSSNLTEKHEASGTILAAATPSKSKPDQSQGLAAE